jgi:hypothetical protein
MAEFRLRRPNPLAGAGEELLAAYAGLEADFFEFLPDALAFARSVSGSAAEGSGSSAPGPASWRGTWRGRRAG